LRVEVLVNYFPDSATPSMLVNSASKTVQRENDQSVQCGRGREAAGGAERVKAVADQLASRSVAAHVSSGDRLGDDGTDDPAQLMLGVSHVVPAVEQRDEIGLAGAVVVER
jgi:hypothetical protein